MKFNESIPIYLQIKEEIENAIISQTLKEEEKIASIRDMAKHYRVNPQTISNAYNELMNEDILYKKRGIGMFVLAGARQRLLTNKTKQFLENDLQQVFLKGKAIGISLSEIIRIAEKIFQGGN